MRAEETRKLNMLKNTFFNRIVKTNWWSKAASHFIDRIKTLKNGRILVLYNADADGFCSSYFIVKSLCSEGNYNNIITKAVWNFEFDFDWLPGLVDSAKPEVVISLDTPIIQEPQILKLISSQTEVLIYDHHIVPKNFIPILNVSYINSRLLDDNKENFPTTFFISSLFYTDKSFEHNDFIILFCGLHGDYYFNKNDDLKMIAESNFKSLFDGFSDRKSKIDLYTGKINSLFRAFPEKTPHNAQQFIIQKLSSFSIEDTLNLFDKEYQIAEAQKKITSEVNNAIEKIKSVPCKGDICCEVLQFKTFSVGIVSTVLAFQKYAEVVSIGFKSKTKIQFELRTHEDSKVDLTVLLDKQRNDFTPITSGGHPKAAGALINKSDADTFCKTLTKSFKSLYNRE
jgi:single-stranded DNA-specific DHH superfamily exonuclease